MPRRPALAALFLLTPLAVAEPAPRPLVIANVTVIDAAGGAPKPNRAVVIADGRISEVVEAGKVVAPADAVLIDGTGKFLIPGLWDMHAHLLDARMLDLCLAHGVTGVRHMYSAWPLFRVERPGGTAPGRPRVVAANGALDGPDSLFPSLMRRNLKRAADGDAAKRAVRELHESGEEFIKVFSMLPRDAYFAAAAEAKRLGVPLAGHVPYLVTVAEASDAGQRSVEHLEGVPGACARDAEACARELAALFRERTAGRADGSAPWRMQLKAHDAYDAANAKALFAKFVANGTWQTPTLAESWAKSRLADPKFTGDARLGQLPETLRALWRVEAKDGAVELPGVGLKLTAADLDGRKLLIEAELKLVGRMHKAGVPLLAGTDTPNPYCFPGAALHDELALLVKAGLTPLEALQAATRNPARFLGREKELGTAEKGKLADLVLLDADPLADIANVRKVAGVVAGGRYLDKKAIEKLLKP
jgi:hypothetical protein